MCKHETNRCLLVLDLFFLYLYLIEQSYYDKNIQQFAETLSLCNNDKEPMIAKHRSKVKEDETRNVDNWNKHFDELK